MQNAALNISDDFYSPEDVSKTIERYKQKPSSNATVSSAKQYGVTQSYTKKNLVLGSSTIAMLIACQPIEYDKITSFITSDFQDYQSFQTTLENTNKLLNFSNQTLNLINSNETTSKFIQLAENQVDYQEMMEEKNLIAAYNRNMKSFIKSKKIKIKL